MPQCASGAASHLLRRSPLSTKIPNIERRFMASARANRPRRIQGAELLTTSATTGWFDWIHGELWLLPSGLLRIRLGLWKTLLHSIGFPTNPRRMKLLPFDSSNFTTTIANPNPRWIPRERMIRAYLHHGFTADRLRLELSDGSTIKFLWLPGDNALEPLGIILSQWLGSNLIRD